MERSDDLSRCLKIVNFWEDRNNVSIIFFFGISWNKEKFFFVCINYMKLKGLSPKFHSQIKIHISQSIFITFRNLTPPRSIFLNTWLTALSKNPLKNPSLKEYQKYYFEKTSIRKKKIPREIIGGIPEEIPERILRGIPVGILKGTPEVIHKRTSIRENTEEYCMLEGIPGETWEGIRRGFLKKSLEESQ